MKVKMNFEQYFILIYCLLAALKLTWGENCEKVDICSCKTSKGTVDLHKIPNSILAIKNGTYTFQYKPCTELTGTCDDASAGVAVCQRSSGGSYNIGNLDSVIFSGDPESTLTANYTAFSSGSNRESVFTIKCDRETTGKLTNVTESPKNTYNFELHTQYACFGSSGGGSKPSKKISTGSVLLIIFFLFTGIYFIAGMLFLKFARGAQGTEMVPNYDFWAALPGYIKDGVTFTCRGCKTESSYSQI